MSSRIATFSVTACALGLVSTAIVFGVAAARQDADPGLEDFSHDPLNWIWAITPYVLMTVMAVAVRKRTGASLFVLCVSLPTIFIAVMSVYESLKPLTPGANEFARGLGPQMIPLGQWCVVIATGLVILGYDWLRERTTRR